MVKPAMVSLFCGALMIGAAPARASDAPYECRLRETTAFLPELSTYSGYRWIECLVVGPAAVDVDGVAINRGKCMSFSNWYAGRSFARGEAIYIPYACLSPVTVTIAGNGVANTMRLR